jgi:hypothetical protein
MSNHARGAAQAPTGIVVSKAAEMVSGPALSVRRRRSAKAAAVLAIIAEAGIHGPMTSRSS